MAAVAEIIQERLPERAHFDIVPQDCWDLCSLCWRINPNDRPTMAEVIQMLEGLNESKEHMPSPHTDPSLTDCQQSEIVVDTGSSAVFDNEAGEHFRDASGQ